MNMSSRTASRLLAFFVFTLFAIVYTRIVLDIGDIYRTDRCEPLEPIPMHDVFGMRGALV